MQINPPFDGSTPCPMCSVEVRNIAAMIHNMLNRCRDDGSIEGKAFVKLFDMREYERPVETVPHPAVTELLDCFDELKVIASDMTVEGLNIKWTPATREKLTAIVPRLRAASAAAEDLSEAHFVLGFTTISSRAWRRIRCSMGGFGVRTAGSTCRSRSSTG